MPPTLEMATGGHLEEQLACVLVPSLTSAYFVEMEQTLDTYLKSLLVMKQMLSAGQEEKQIATTKLIMSLTLLPSHLLHGSVSK